MTSESGGKPTICCWQQGEVWIIQYHEMHSVKPCCDDDGESDTVQPEMKRVHWRRRKGVENTSPMESIMGPEITGV